MKTSTRISKKHGAMQIVKGAQWAFWFDQNNSGVNGNWYPITAKSIDYWMGKDSPLTKADKFWFDSALN